MDSVRLLKRVDASGGIAVCIELREGDEAHPGEFKNVREVLASSPGDGALYLKWHPEGNGVEPPMLASSSLKVEPSRGAARRSQGFVGPGAGTPDSRIE